MISCCCDEEEDRDGGVTEMLALSNSSPSDPSGAVEGFRIP